MLQHFKHLNLLNFQLFQVHKHQSCLSNLRSTSCLASSLTCLFTSQNLCTYILPSKKKKPVIYQKSLRNYVFRRSTQTNESSGYSGSTSLIPTVGVMVLLSSLIYFKWYMEKIPDNTEAKEKKQFSEYSENEPTQSVIKSGLIEPAVELSLILDERSKSPDLNLNPDLINASSSETGKIDSVHSETTTNNLTEEVDLEEESFPALVYVDSNKREFPNHVPYLIIGAGTAGLSASRAIRASDPKSKILLISGGTDKNELISEPGLVETNSVEPPPYLRPPLSKELWNRSGPREAILLNTDGDIRRHSWLYYEAESFYMDPMDLNAAEYGGVGLVRGDPVVRLDPDRHLVTLASGKQISYDRCLLATGGHSRRIKELETCQQSGKNLIESGHLSYFRTLYDYKQLRNLINQLKETGGRVAIIGGGFLGSELAVSVSKSVQNDPDGDSEKKKESKSSGSKDVSVIHTFRESVPMANVLPPCLASAVSRYESREGVQLFSSSDVVSLSLVPPVKQKETNSQTKPLPDTDVEQKQKVKLRLRISVDGVQKVQETEVDHVICAIGVEPNVDLAREANMEIDIVNGGFLVNAEMESRRGVYAAGDAASYWDPIVGCRRRVEHLNFAEETGALAGKNMVSSLLTKHDVHADFTPKSSTYSHQSSLWSSLGPEVSWEAVGHVDAKSLVTYSFFANESKQKDDDETKKTDSVGNQRFGSIPQADLGHLNHGIIFYLTPRERRLVGILLWNLPSELYTDKDFPAPNRLNLARSVLAEQRLLGRDSTTKQWNEHLEQSDLKKLAQNFDLYSEMEADYQDLKKFMQEHEKQQREQKEDSGDFNQDAGKSHDDMP